MTVTTMTRLAGLLRQAGADRPDHQSDAQLLERFRDRRDSAAFEALVRRHGRCVLTACRRVLTNPADMEDAFQATFLVLLRKSGDVRVRGSLGGWLYGVAHRTALRARATAARRQRLAERAARPVEAPATEDVSWQEACAVLHEELNKLPDKLRLPLLLCYLEGLSRDEAARRLGRTTATIKGDLERGRERLRQRLMRRGIGLSAGLLSAVAGRSAFGGPSPELVRQTVQSVITGAGPAVTELVRGAMPMTMVKKTMLPLVAVATLVAGLTAGTIAVPSHSPQQAAVSPPVAAKPSEPPAGMVRGRVLTPDGKPAANVAIYLRERDLLHEQVKESKATTTGPDGRFELPYVRWANVAAVANGFALDWANPEPGGGEVTMTLAEDVPIHGRLFDLQGKPVAKAKVRVLALMSPIDGNLRPAYNAFRLNPEWIWQSLPKQFVNGSAKLLPTTTTRADGSFELHGIGKGRVAEIRFEAPTIESARVYVVADPRFDPKLVTATPTERRQNSFGPEYRPAVYGPTFTHAARPCHVITGTVTDAVTGQPVSGVTVAGTAGPIDLFRNEAWGDAVETVTDAAGRFHLNGLPKAKLRHLLLKAGDRPYLDRLIEVKESPGLAPVTVNVRLYRAVIVVGQLIEAASGRPVRGEVFYSPLKGNALLKMHPDSRLYRGEVSAPVTGTHAYTGADGRFRLRVPLGLGVVQARADTSIDPTARFVPARAADADRKYLLQPLPGTIQVGPTDPPGEEFFDTGRVSPLRWENGYAIIEPKGFASPTMVTIEFDRGRTMTGRVVDPSGKPLAGCQGVGLGGEEFEPTTFPTDQFTVYALDGRRPRTIYFVHERRKLVGTVTVRGDEKEPPVAHLVAWAAVTGRLLDHDGKPAIGAEVWFQMSQSENDEFIRSKLYQQRRIAKTDAAGRFTLEGMFPGCDFSVNANKPGHRSGISYPAVKLKPGETRDLGERRFPDPKKMDH